MRAAIFLACALGTSSMATATGNLMTDLVLGLARDVHDARATFGGTTTSPVVPSFAASHVRRRLQAAEPSQATDQKLANAWDAAMLKLAGDAADCVNKFFPVSSGTVTAEQHANQDKLQDSLKHFPFIGAFVSAATTYTGQTCTCDTGFLNDSGDSQCLCSSGSDCPDHTPCDYDDGSGGCQSYTSTACTDAQPPTDDMMVNLAEAGASLRFNKDGADTDIVMYLYDSGDDYEDNCPDAWDFHGCKDFRLSATTTSKKDAIAPGFPEDDVEGTSTMSAQVPACAPGDCFDSLPDLVDDMNDFIKDAASALNEDPAISTSVHIGDVTVDVGFCWPRWYNMIFMIFGTALCLACSVFAAKQTIFKKNAPEGLLTQSGTQGGY